jgi:hypothetical protein
VTPKPTGVKFCAECAPVEHEASLARKTAKRRAARKPCRGCGRVKQAEVGPSPYCVTCRRARSAPKQCRRGCGRPVRAKMAKLCVECAALAVQEQKMRKRRWEQRTGYVKPMVSLTPTERRREGARITYRLARERAGQEVGMAAPIMSKGRRVDAAVFPSLPSKPLADAIERMIVRRRNPFAIPVRNRAGKLRDVERESVCRILHMSARTLGRWANGELPSVSFDMADAILRDADWLWFDVWEPCPGDHQHLQDVTLWGSCSRCEAYCAAEDAFTSTETAADRVGGQLRLEAA